MRRRWARRISGAVVLIGLAWFLIHAAVGWWARAELVRAGSELALGKVDQARGRLNRILTVRPSMAEVYHQLGLCEEAAGRPDLALACWARITPGSPVFSKAARNRDRLLQDFLDRGRFGALEELLVVVRQGAGADALEATRSLIRLLRFQGRFDEVKRLLREEWAAAEDPSRPLRELWALDAEPPPLGMVEGILDRAASRAPDDDRVWLGRANLATWAGRFDEADTLLTNCLARRAEDPAVWRSRLAWARAAGRPAAAGEAVARLPSDRIETVEALELEAWFAAEREDRAAERRALELLVSESPGNARALDRLATLAVEAGEVDHAAALRRRKRYADQARELYRKSLANDATTIDLPTVGRLAESLGRWFEARGWWSLVLRFKPNDLEASAAIERLARRQSPPRRRELIHAAALASGISGRVPTLPKPEFTDEAEASGLRFTYDPGRTPARHLPETMGGGVGLIDYDGDGWLDVYCVQGGRFPPPKISTTSNVELGDRLFRNCGDGTFEDVTDRSGLSALPGGYGHGVAVGDYDDDGWPDVFATRWGSYALYRNQRDGTFTDVTSDVGLAGHRDWPTSAAWADLDGDGDLDLYVCHYLKYDPDHPPFCGRSSPEGSTQLEYCDPRKFEATRDRLFRNDDGRFVDVSEEAGISDADGRGLGVVAADLDEDGRVDLYVAND
ncbi:MAG: FG-GAP-like repeat-containing protein, partial [Isosphaeraceae bacterium]